MSEGIPEGTAGVADAAAGADTQGQTDNGGSGDNPAWGQLLESLPEGLHGVVKPYLQEWDKGVQQRFQQVQSQYAPLKAYESFAQQQVDPQSLENAYALYQALNTNPEAVWRQMGEHYKFQMENNGGQGQPGTQTSDDFLLDDPSGQSDITEHPQFKALKEQMENLQNGLRQAWEQQQAEQKNAQQDAQLAQELTTLKQKHGIPEDDEEIEQMAIGLAMTGVPLDQAFDRIIGKIGNTMAGRPGNTAPQVMPTSGGIPSSQVNPAELDNKSTKSLVAQMLAAANQG